MNFLKKSIFLSSISLLIILAQGCADNSIDPFEESAGYYSIYGAASLGSERNYIRVRDLQTPLLPDTNTLIRPVVTFENITTGNSVTLRDTLVDPANTGNYTINYILEEDLQPREQYRVLVEGPEGKTASSTASSPGVTEPSITNSEIFNCETPVEFIFDNVQQPEYVRMEAGFYYDGGIYFHEIGTVNQLKFESEQEDRMTVEMTITNLLAEVFPPIPETTVGVPPRFWRPTVTCNELDVKTLLIRYIHFGPEWSTIKGAGDRPLEILESGTVTDGVGFFGVIRRGSFEKEFGQSE